jgi:DNA-binding SARP family transcriptional activator
LRRWLPLGGGPCSTGALERAALGAADAGVCRSGRQADALAAYQQLRHRLVDELGIARSQPLQRLHRQIVAVDPGLAPFVAASSCP